MTTLTITLPDERVQQLQALASRLQVTPEKLIEASLDSLLIQPDEELQQRLDYILNKNAELYHRLA